MHCQSISSWANCWAKWTHKPSTFYMLCLDMVFDNRAPFGIKRTLQAVPMSSFCMFLLIKSSRPEHQEKTNQIIKEFYFNLSKMFTPENMHFKRLSCWADMSANYTGVSLWWYVFRLYMFSYRAGGLGRILTTWANPKPFHIFVHLASDHGVNFWKCISFNLMFVSYFMHFHGMSSWADFQTLGTLKTRQGDVPCLYMGFNCCFCWVWIITGKAAPTNLYFS